MGLDKVGERNMCFEHIRGDLLSVTIGVVPVIDFCNTIMQVTLDPKVYQSASPGFPKTLQKRFYGAFLENASIVDSVGSQSFKMTKNTFEKLFLDWYIVYLRGEGPV